MPYLEYVKLWTSVLSDSWFLSLNCSERGLFLQLILLAKTAENSAPKFKSWRAVGELCGSDGKTVRKYLGRFRTFGKCDYKTNEYGMIEVTISNYQFYQSLSPNKEGRKSLAEKGKSEDGVRNIPHLQRQLSKKQEAVKTTATTLLASFNNWMVENGEDVASAFRVNWAHVGGEDQLRLVADEIREAIQMCPTDVRWQQHKDNQTWGNCIRYWNKNKIRAGEVS